METSKGHRLPIGFTAAQHAAIAERAEQRGLSLSATVRQLVSAALARDAEAGGKADSPASVAALIAAEHTLLVVASILPQGRSLIASLTAEAAAAAEQRLSLVEGPGPGDDEMR